MLNALNAYDPLFYVNNALMYLTNNLGMAGRVYRDTDLQQIPRSGRTGKMRRPSNFTATAVDTSTGGTTQDVDTEEVDITYDQWHEVKFAVYEDELAFAGQRFIEEHINPAAYALADKIDQSLTNLYKHVPSSVIAGVTPGVADVTAARQALFNQKAPNDGMRALMMGGAMEAALLNLTAFNQNDGAGAVGVSTQTTGDLGRKFGFDLFANQNTPSHTTGAMADTAGALNGAGAKGATTISIDALTDADTIEPGDTFSIAGNDQKYSYVGTATLTVSGSAVSNIEISPPLQAAYADNAVVTFEAGASASTKTVNLAFHKAAFGLKFAELPQIANEMGARISMQTDPVTGLSLRARMFYEGDNNRIKVALDALWAVTTLDPRLAVRVREN